MKVFIVSFGNNPRIQSINQSIKRERQMSDVNPLDCILTKFQTDRFRTFDGNRAGKI